MKQSRKGFDYSCNTQAAVDAANRVIVAAEAANAANDKQQGVPLGQAALDNLAAAGIALPTAADGTPAPIPNTLDSGYSSAEAVEKLAAMGIDPHIATGRRKHNEAPAPLVEGAPPPAASVKEKMRHRLPAATGKLPYAARKHIVEPVFGRIKSARGIRAFLLGGLEKVAAEWQLTCLTHNPLKRWRCSCRANACWGLRCAPTAERRSKRPPLRMLEAPCNPNGDFSDNLLALIPSSSLGKG